MDLNEVISIATDISSQQIAGNAEKIDREGLWPKENISALFEAGLGGLVVPAADGGLGFGMDALVRIGEVIGRECASTALCFGMHCVASAVIAAKATDHHRERYLRPINEGRHLTSLALSEPGTGAHFYFPQTQLLLKDGTYKVTGKKTFVTNGSHADSYVVSTMAAASDASPDLFSCIIIDGDEPKLEWGPPWTGIGMRGNSSLSLDINSIEVDTRQLLGEEGDQLWYIFNVVAPYFLIAMAGTYLGVGSAALDKACQHLSERQYSHSGQSLSEQQLMQYKLGKMWSKLESSRSMLYRAAKKSDKGDIEALPLLLASKAEIAVATNEVISEAMIMTGGIGYRVNSSLARYMRDAKAAHIMTPTTDLLYSWIGRGLLGQPLLSS